MMNKYIAGIIAGFVATVVLSLLMILKGMMGLMPDLDLIGLLASMMDSSRAIGWVAHFMIGSIGYGIVMALVGDRSIDKNLTLVGVMIGFVGWLVMMLALLPMMGKGLFGLNMPSGIMIPIATLMLHLIFGGVLGGVYAKLIHRR